MLAFLTDGSTDGVAYEKQVRRLMTAIEDQARGMGVTLLKLDSNSALTEALALYRASGWTPTAPYTSAPADIWLEKML